MYNWNRCIKLDLFMIMIYHTEKHGVTTAPGRSLPVNFYLAYITIMQVK